MSGYNIYSQIWSAAGILLDVITLCMPLPIIVGLQMKLKQKLLVVGILWLGFL